MKALFHGTIVDIIEKSDKGYRILTAYGVILIEAEKITEIPDELFKSYENELLKIETFIMEIREKVKDIDHRYYLKKQELDKAITKAQVRKQQIVGNFRASSLNLKPHQYGAEMEEQHEKT